LRVRAACCVGPSVHASSCCVDVGDRLLVTQPVVSGHSVSDRSLIADWLMAVSRDRPPRTGYILRRTVVKVSSQTMKWPEQSRDDGRTSSASHGQFYTSLCSCLSH